MRINILVLTAAMLLQVLSTSNAPACGCMDITFYQNVIYVEIETDADLVPLFEMSEKILVQLSSPITADTELQSFPVESSGDLAVESPDSVASASFALTNGAYEPLVTLAGRLERYRH